MTDDMSESMIDFFERMKGCEYSLASNLSSPVSQFAIVYSSPSTHQLTHGTPTGRYVMARGHA